MRDPETIIGLLVLGGLLSVPSCVSPRSELPSLPTPPAVVAPAPEIRELSNGVQLWHTRSQQVPMIALVTVVPYGAVNDPQGQSGLASLTAAMLDEGAGSHGALELADEIDYLGATLSTSSSMESSMVSLRVLRQKLEPALDLFADVLLRPRFDEKEWKRVKALRINELAQRGQSPGAVARLVGYRVFFGAGHPYGRPESGYRKNVEALTLEDVKQFYAGYWRPEGATIVSAGDITIDELKALFETRLGNWHGKGEPPAARPTPAPAPLPPEPRSRPNVVIVDKKGATQTYVRIVGPGIPRSDPDYTTLRLANVVFGGSFTSRLTQNLRETHGYTYGVRSDLTRYRGPGAFVAESSVQKDVTGESIGEFFNEYREIAAGGINEMELRKARATLTQSVVSSLETLSGTVGLFAALARSGLPPTDAERLLEEVERARQADLDKAAAAHIRIDPATIVLVGDRATIEKELGELGGVALDVSVVDEEGAPVQ